MWVTNIGLRVLFVKIADEVGTAFTIEHKDHQYIITAKHLFEKVRHPNKLDVEFMINKAWIKKSAKVLYHKSNIDIAVIQLNTGEDFTKRLEIHLGSDLFCGMDLFFLGFPYGYTMEFDYGAENRPIPFIKKAIYSGRIFDNGVQVNLMDGHNNSGFSGGPVYHVNKQAEVYIAGVISSYRYNCSKLHDFKGNELPFFIKENSGIVMFYPIKYVIEILESI